MIRAYQDLRVWRDGMRLARRCYEVTRSFPPGEQFGLTSQIRRAASSVPANIAEGNGRSSARDYVRFLAIANGSLCELETHLMLALDVGLLSPDDARSCLALAMTTGRKLRALAASLRTAMHVQPLPSHPAAHAATSRWP